MIVILEETLFVTRGQTLRTSFVLWLSVRVWGLEVQDKRRYFAPLSFNLIKFWQIRLHSNTYWGLVQSKTSYKQSQSTLLIKHIPWTVNAGRQPDTSSQAHDGSMQRFWTEPTMCFSSPWMCSRNKRRHRWKKKVLCGSDLSPILLNCST